MVTDPAGLLPPPPTCHTQVLLKYVHPHSYIHQVRYREPVLGKAAHTHLLEQLLPRSCNLLRLPPALEEQTTELDRSLPAATLEVQARIQVRLLQQVCNNTILCLGGGGGGVTPHHSLQLHVTASHPVRECTFQAMHHF